MFPSMFLVGLSMKSYVRDDPSANVARLLVTLRPFNALVDLSMSPEVLDRLAADGAEPHRPFNTSMYQLVFVHVDDRLATNITRL